MHLTKQQHIIELVHATGILRTRDVMRAGIPTTVLSRMVKNGILIRIGRGLYELPGAEVSEHHTLAEAARRMPEGVVCLLSALSFHELTTEQPLEVWMAHKRGTRAAKSGSPRLRLFQFSSTSFESGVEIYKIDGVPVHITTPAKTVADCFKFRSTVGLDVAVEAARDYLRTHSGSMDELWEAAQVCRVQNVMRPYLEALV